MNRARRTTAAVATAALGLGLLAVSTAPARAAAPAPLGPPTLVAGGWGVGGPASQVRFGGTAPIPAVLADGRVAWADTYGNAVHVRNADGTVGCLAGCSHAPGFSGDGGAATAAHLNFPSGLAAAPDGSLYVSDAGNLRLRRIAADGTISTVAGTGSATTWTASGPATSVDVRPAAVAVGSDGTVYVVDTAVRNVVRKLVGTTLSTAVGGVVSVQTYWDDTWNGGPATGVTLGDDTAAYGIAVAPDKSLLIATVGGRRVLRAPVDGTIASVAGVGGGVAENLGDGGAATSAVLAAPVAVVAEANGTIDVATDDAIRSFTVGGTISTKLAGLPSLSALLLRSGAYLTVGRLALRPDGNATVVIRSTTSGGVTTVLAGDKPSQTGDGQQLADASFAHPQDTLTLDDGTLLVADGSGLVRGAGPDGIVHTVAGSSLGALAFSGEGGPATSAVLPHPRALARDAAGNLYIACGDGAVRKVLASDGTIRTVLGTGTPWSGSAPAGPLPGTSMPLSQVLSMSVAADSSLFVVDGDGGVPWGYRVLHLVGTTATQVTGSTSSVFGAAAVGHPVTDLGTVSAAGLAADGTLAVIDINGYLYRTSADGTITRVTWLTTISGVTRIAASGVDGLLVSGTTGVVRFHDDGSQEWYSDPYGSAWSWGGQKLTWVEQGTGLYQRTLPDVLSRPAAPVGVVGVSSDGFWQAVRTTSVLPAASSLEWLAYPGAAQAVPPADATQLSTSPIQAGAVWLTNVTGAQPGDTITVVGRVVGAESTSTWSTWTFVWRLPQTCVLSPTSRVVAYGATVAARATVSRSPIITPGIAGTWTVAPGGLASTRYAAAPTSSLGTTARAVKVLRTTTVYYTATSAGAVGGCVAKTVYSVRGVLKAVPAVASAKRGAAVRITGVLAPKVARQYVTLQRLVGTKWVSLVRGLTTTAGTVVFSTKLPTKAGYAYYRVVSTTSTALLGGVSAAVRVRAL